MSRTYQCVWPGCRKEGFASSGDICGAIVCREHFEITNGKTNAELSDYERGVCNAIADLFLRSSESGGFVCNVKTPMMEVE